MDRLNQVDRNDGDAMLQPEPSVIHPPSTEADSGHHQQFPDGLRVLTRLGRLQVRTGGAHDLRSVLAPMPARTDTEVSFLSRRRMPNSCGELLGVPFAVSVL